MSSCTYVKGDVPLSDTDVPILNGAVVVNFLKLKPLAVKTVDDYELTVFLPYTQDLLQNASRVDIVWDQYHVKSETRSKRGRASGGELLHPPICLGDWLHLQSYTLNVTRRRQRRGTWTSARINMQVKVLLW